MQYVASFSNCDTKAKGMITLMFVTMILLFYVTQKVRRLEPEESDNTSFGIVLTPQAFEGLTITLDA